MSFTYREILFVPDPYNGTVFSVGALLEEPEAKRVIVARYLPCERCLSGLQSVRLLRTVLWSVGQFDRHREGQWEHWMDERTQTLGGPLMTLSRSWKIVHPVEGTATDWVLHLLPGGRREDP